MYLSRERVIHKSEPVNNSLLPSYGFSLQLQFQTAVVRILVLRVNKVSSLLTSVLLVRLALLFTTFARVYYVFVLRGGVENEVQAFGFINRVLPEKNI